jgi:hypothetical protein
MADSFTLAAVADVLCAVTSRHASVRDDDGACPAPSFVYDLTGEGFGISAELHPGDATDAARDLLDLLAARGFSLHRVPSIEGNGLGARLARLAATSAQRGHCEIAAAIAALAEEADQRDVTVVPPHLRQVRSGLPDSVASLCERRRA